MLQSTRVFVGVYVFAVIGYYNGYAAPMEYDAMDPEHDSLYDFDTEQSQARYDPKLLSEELKDSAHSSASQEAAAPCCTADVRYEHGQKIFRNDPCEVCLCVDGEIFCWWKKCDHNGKRRKDHRKGKISLWPHHKLPNHSMTKNWKKHQSSKKKSQQKYKMMKFIPKNVLTFPQHLPSAIHQYDINPNETKSISHVGIEYVSRQDVVTSGEKQLPNGFSLATFSFSGGSMNGKKNQEQIETKPTSRILGSNNLYEDDDDEDISVSMDEPDVFRKDINKDSQHNSNRQKQKKGRLYEKAVINDDGVFVEKVSKMNDHSQPPSSSDAQKTIEQTPSMNGNNEYSLKNSNTSSIMKLPTFSLATGNNNGIERKEQEEVTEPLDITSTKRQQQLELANTEKIQFVDVPLSKHYIITSSGSVENADILASENVLSQFRNDYSVVVEAEASSAAPDGTMLSSIPRALSAKSATAANDSGILTTARTTAQGSFQNVPVAAGVVSAIGASEIIGRQVNLGAGDDASSSFSASTSLFSTPRVEMNPSSSDGMVGERECLVMGTPYSIGTVLPQDTGNCLQCICIEGASEGDSPRVTCSPHNCPPLVLPDLFDATGY